MAVQSLAVKYRPRTWEDVMEQSSVKIILQHQLTTDTTKNAYLFVGGAGTGKTTCARIFANEINNHVGNPIEMDAASNSSVDDVREIIQQAKTKSLDSEYKVFIIDECFPGNTMINTSSCPKPISEICVGDVVESMSGNNTVTHIFKNSVLTDRLCCVTINNRKIITTVEHLFFTNRGWIEAAQLRKGDIVYGSKDLQELWTRVCKTTGQGREVLLSQMLDRVCEKESSAENERGDLSNLWKVDDSAKLFQEENLFRRVQEAEYYEVEQTICEYRVWDGVTETIIRKNEEEQSYEESTNYSENAEYEGAEWNPSSVAYSAGWERKIYNSTDSLMAGIRRWLGVRISDKHEKSGLARTSTTLVLQSRPWLFGEKSGDRGRWSRPQVEKFIIEGCEKNTSIENARVESVEIYQRGYNDELFRDSFTDTELSSGYVTMYDLEVENDHSYFVEDVLVHNCHSLSNSAWQALLKLLEEPPTKSVFIFCTTEPQKIPKTILSRVQRYDFQRISQAGIENRLHTIMVAEELAPIPAKTYDDALEFIAKLADGGMRDAITMMDKCLAYSNDLTLDNVVKALGMTGYDDMFYLLKSLSTGDAVKCIECIEDVHNSGKDVKQFMIQFTNFVLDAVKYNLTSSFEFIKIPSTYKKDLDSISFDNIERLLSDLVKLNAEIKWSTSPKQLVEADLLLYCLEGNK